MKNRVFKIVDSYLSNYCDPLTKEMYPDGQATYYPEQEQTYTDLTMLDSPHGEMSFSERYKLVYPDQWENPSWADGDFSSPYKNEFFETLKTSPNDNETLYDPLIGGGVMAMDLGLRNAKAIDNFLNTENMIRIASDMDLTDFMKISEDTLIHKSKKDLWQMFKDKSGNTFIRRLFDDEIIKD